jgi:hypothetical protein
MHLDMVTNTTQSSVHDDTKVDMGIEKESKFIDDNSASLVNLKESSQFKLNPQKVIEIYELKPKNIKDFQKIADPIAYEYKITRPHIYSPSKNPLKKWGNSTFIFDPSAVPVSPAVRNLAALFWKYVISSLESTQYSLVHVKTRRPLFVQGRQ